MGKTIGERIQYLRVAREFSQPKLAEEADIPLRTLQEIEYGKSKQPGINTIAKIARAMRIPIESLLETTVDLPLPDFAAAAKTMEQLAGLDQDFQRLVLSLIYGHVDLLRGRPALEPLIPSVSKLLKAR